MTKSSKEFESELRSSQSGHVILLTSIMALKKLLCPIDPIHIGVFSFGAWELEKDKMASSPARKDDSSGKDSPADVAGEANTAATASTSAAGAIANATATSNISSATDTMDAAQTAAILSYFKKRGFKRAEDSLKAELEELAKGVSPGEARSSVASRFGTPTVSLYDLATKSAPREPAPSNTNTNGSVISNGSNQSGVGPLEQATVEALRLDPTDRIRGFRMLRNWCDGSLDIYQPELKPILLPLFVHAYLDLTEMGYGAAGKYAAD